jgi:hypothetical protein
MKTNQRIIIEKLLNRATNDLTLAIGLMIEAHLLKEIERLEGSEPSEEEIKKHMRYVACSKELSGRHEWYWKGTLILIRLPSSPTNLFQTEFITPHTS